MSPKLDPRRIAKFFPKPKALAALRGRHGSVRVTRWHTTEERTRRERARYVPRGERKEPERGETFFRRTGIKPDYSVERIKPLPEAENAELKEILGYARGGDIDFYRDNRNLFIARVGGEKGGRRLITLRRVRKNGKPESRYFAMMEYSPGQGAGGKAADIIETGLHDWFLEDPVLFATPKAGFSKRGILPAFVDFLSRRGYNRIRARRASIAPGALPAYEKADFIRRGDMMEWTK